jgi:hypothetical protein
MICNTKLPEIPEELENQEPSLYTLYEFVYNAYKEPIPEINALQKDCSGMNKYMESVQKNGYYYLLGNIKTDPTTPLTTELLEKAQKEQQRRLIEIGICNSMEMCSVQHSITCFKQVVYALETYYKYHPLIYYKPGAMGFMKAQTDWEERNGI